MIDLFVRKFPEIPFFARYQSLSLLVFVARLGPAVPRGTMAYRGVHFALPAGR